MVDVFTDGACSGNPGPGGWAWVTADGRFDSGGADDTTNQRMELTAVLEAVTSVPGPLHVHSDSTYVVNCFQQRWYDGWLARGWRNSQRKPVANRDLWEPLIDAYQERSDEIRFTWVKGHAGVPLNEEADRLAVEALQRHRDRLPGPAAPATGADVPWEPWRAVVVTGARILDRGQRDGLAEAIDGLDPDNDIAVSGLRLGAELEGAERAVAAGVPLAVCLPFADPARAWSVDDRRRFDAMVDAATWVVTLDGDPTAPGAAITARNDWLLEAAVGAIVVGDDDVVDRAERAGLGVVVVE